MKGVTASHKKLGAETHIVYPQQWNMNANTKACPPVSICTSVELCQPHRLTCQKDKLCLTPTYLHTLRTRFPCKRHRRTINGWFKPPNKISYTRFPCKCHRRAINGWFKPPNKISNTRFPCKRHRRACFDAVCLTCSILVVSCRRCRGAALVCIRQHQCQQAQGKEHPHLGWKFVKGVPGLCGTQPQVG